MTTEKNAAGWRRYDADKTAYPQMRNDILGDAEAADVSRQQQLKLELGAEEMLINIILYAYEGAGYVWVKTGTAGNRFRLEIADHGKPFNPLEKDMRRSKGVPAAEQEEGGYGIFLARKNFSRLSYQYEEMFGKPANHLLMELPVS